jgi:hypothetical protein
MTWDEACARARSESLEPVEQEAKVLAAPRLIVVDHFDLTMVDMGAPGARLHVRPLTRLEALTLAHRSRAPAIALNERGQNLLEKELQIEPAVRPQARFGTDLLVVHWVRWNDLRCYLVVYEADGDGCVP